MVAVLTLGPLAVPAQTSTYYLDAEAAGPVFEGTKGKPWKTVEQMQTFLAAREGHGGGDEVLISAGNYGIYMEAGNFYPNPSWLRSGCEYACHCECWGQ